MDLCSAWATVTPLDHVNAFPAAKKWCLWHRDCNKEHWTPEGLVETLYNACSVDDLQNFHGDVAGVPPASKMLDCYHANKNGLNSWTKAVWKKYPAQRKEVRTWLEFHKKGVGMHRCHLTRCLHWACVTRAVLSRF